jgi:hypothetical protein
MFDINNVVNVKPKISNYYHNPIETNVVLITPELAKKWLENNMGNRKLRSSWVDTLAMAIKNNEFMFTHQAIAFSQSGRLLDGQHRLKAIVLANKPVRMLVTTNLDEEIFSAIDCGIKRNISDLTNLQKGTADVCKTLASLIYRQLAGNATPAHTIKIAESGIAALCDEMLEVCNSTRRIVSSTPIRCAAIIHILNGEPKQKIFESYRNLVLYNFDKLSPIQLNFIKQISESLTINTNYLYYFLPRGLKIFNPDCQHITTLRIKDSETTSQFNLARTVLKNHMGEA